MRSLFPSVFAYLTSWVRLGVAVVLGFVLSVAVPMFLGVPVLP